MSALISIEVGDRIPDFTFRTAQVGPDGGCPLPREVTSSQVFDGKTVVLVAVPGAFTQTCSSTHVPGFLEKHEELKEKGVDTVAVVSVNDVFVLAYWGAQLDADGRLMMLADGNGTFAKMLGLEQDLSKNGLGVRSQRYAMVVKDRVVKYLGIDAGELSQSTATAVLQNL